ncbi:MAG: glycosyltransferase, partial [Candidatus Omnitrophota bacterium]
VVYGVKFKKEPVFTRVMQKKINILHIIPALGMGGAEKVVFNLCRKIDRQRYSVSVMYWGPGEDFVEAIKATGANVIKIGTERVVSLDTILKTAGIIRELSADLIHTHFMDADLTGFLASKITRTPQIIDIHSYPFPVKASHCVRYRMMSGFTGRILCVSGTVKKYLMSKTGIAPAGISVVHNGIGLEEFSTAACEVKKTELRKEFKIKDGALVIGNISRLIPDKGHRDLILSAPRVFEKYPDCVFLIVGYGELEGELKALTCKLGISDRVIFAGKRVDIKDILDVMDIFVFPTFNEAFGLTVLEAMAAGKPVIGTDDAGIPEIIESGRDGILVHPGDSVSLGKAMISLMEDSLLARRIGEEAREKVKKFSDEAMTRKTEEIYDEVLKKRQKMT